MFPRLPGKLFFVGLFTPQNMSQLTNYFPSKKRARSSPGREVKSKVIVMETKEVVFVQRGMLSPKKRDNLDFVMKARKLEELKVALAAVKKFEIKEREVGNEIPAFKRHAHLLQKKPTLPLKPTTPDPKLPLPSKFQTLLNLFTAVETVATISNQLQFSKLKASVQILVKTTSLKESHIGHFLAVLPGVYQVSREKNELVVAFPPNFSPNLINSRAKEFKEKLLEILIKEHEAFLREIGIEIPADKKLSRFHPKFRLDQVPLPLPHPLPPKIEETVLNARQVLDLAKDVVKGTRMERALADNSKEIKIKEKEKLKGVSAALLEKIRARSRQKTIATLTETPQEAKLARQKAKLPKLPPIIHSLFTMESKAALPLSLVTSRVAHSLNDGSSQDTIEGLLRLLCQVVPWWLTLIKSSEGEYLKIVKVVELCQVFEVLNFV